MVCTKRRGPFIYSFAEAGILKIRYRVPGYYSGGERIGEPYVTTVNTTIRGSTDNQTGSNLVYPATPAFYTDRIS